MNWTYLIGIAGQMRTYEYAMEEDEKIIWIADTGTTCHVRYV